MTPLHYGAINGHLIVVEYLNNNGADINGKNVNGITSLHLSAKNGHLNVVEFLVNKKTDINPKSNDIIHFFLIKLLFILLQLMAITMLLII